MRNRLIAARSKRPFNAVCSQLANVSRVDITMASLKMSPIMKTKRTFQFLSLVCPLAMLSLEAQARLFTDDQGRQVEAEIVGTRGDNVVLSSQGARGQWPVSRLAAKDQAYVKEWTASHTAVKKVGVQVFERDGIGEKGEFPKEEKGSSPLPEKLPIGPKVETKAAYHHCDLTISNTANVDASLLKVDYVLYTINDDGSVGANAGTQPIASLPAGKSSNITTEGITALRTKTTKLKLNITRNNASVSEKTDRSKDQFGGCWVRVSGPDGTVIGEAKKLTPALEKLDPPWSEVAVKEEEIPVLKSFEGFKELLKKVLPPGGGPLRREGGPRLPGLPKP